MADDMKSGHRSRLAFIVMLFASSVPGIMAQKTRASVADNASLEPARSSPGAAQFTDATSALGLDFEYVASHTSRKYLIETMGSGVARLSANGRASEAAVTVPKHSFIRLTAEF